MDLPEELSFYSDDRIQALLKAIQTKNYGRVLAKPKVLVDDGSEGNISTTETTSYKQETTQLTGPDQTTSYDYYVCANSCQNRVENNTAHQRGRITAARSYNVAKRFWRDDPNPAAPPDTTSNDIITTVFVPDDKTIILGGLVKLRQTK